MEGTFKFVCLIGVYRRSQFPIQGAFLIICVQSYYKHTIVPNSKVELTE